MNKKISIPTKLYLSLSIIFWVLVWWIAAAIFGKPLLLPTPPAVLTALGALALKGEFYATLLFSLSRILFGILLALLAGALLALATVKSALLHQLFSPLLSAFKATPVASVIFLMLLWVGRQRVPAVIAFMMALPIVWANMREGLLQTDKSLLEMASAFGVPRGRVLLSIHLPSVKPYFLSACRASIGVAWKAGIAAEVLCVPERSIGRAIYEGKLYLLTEDLFAWTFVVILISVLIEWGILSLLDRAKKAEDEKKETEVME